MNKIPPEYRPIVYIIFAFILLTIFYLMFTHYWNELRSETQYNNEFKYQQCKRKIADQDYSNYIIMMTCLDKTLW